MSRPFPHGLGLLPQMELTHLLAPFLPEHQINPSAQCRLRIQSFMIDGALEGLPTAVCRFCMKKRLIANEH